MVAKMKQLVMADDERVYGALELGYADTEDGIPFRTPLDRTGNEVTNIRPANLCGINS